MKKYPTVGLGGTFDHLHIGHQQFIRFAAARSEKLIIGVTTPVLNQQKLWPRTIEGLFYRRQTIKKFCRQEKITAKIIDLFDPYGPALETGPLDALTVTPETLPTAEKINDLRRLKRFPELPILICQLVNDESGQPLHSENIRHGRVNQQGIVYLEHLKGGLVLNDYQRSQLRLPLGKVIVRPFHNRSKNPVVVAVGDTTLEKFQQFKKQYTLAVYDGYQQHREPSHLATYLVPDLTVSNPAGSISAELTSGLVKALDNSLQLIKVEGEEDLATASLILLLPLQSLLYYGQPDVGMVEVVITQHLKDQIYNLLISDKD